MLIPVSFLPSTLQRKTGATFERLATAYGIGFNTYMGWHRRGSAPLTTVEFLKARTPKVLVELRAERESHYRAALQYIRASYGRSKTPRRHK